jgi:hypothetical protein
MKPAGAAVSAAPAGFMASANLRVLHGNSVS